MICIEYYQQWYLMELTVTTNMKKLHIFTDKQLNYTDFFHVKQDSDPFFIANVDTLDAHVDFKYSAFILFSSFVEVALAFLQRWWRNSFSELCFNYKPHPSTLNK